MPEELYTTNDRMQMGLNPTSQLNQAVLCVCTSRELFFKEASVLLTKEKKSQDLLRFGLSVY